MDVLERGSDEPSSPVRARLAVSAAVAMALGIVVARHHHSSPGPDHLPPVAVSVTPAPTPSPADDPTPLRDPGVTLTARGMMPCDWFLGQLSLPTLDKWGAIPVWTRRAGNTQTRTYQRAGGEIRVTAGCGPIATVLPPGADPATNIYLDSGISRSRLVDGPRTLIWRANEVAGWYRIESDGGGGSVVTVTELRQLKRAIDAGARSI